MAPDVERYVSVETIYRVITLLENVHALWDGLVRFFFDNVSVVFISNF